MAGAESEPFECVVVGGGIHGTYVADALCESLDIDTTTLALVDPNDRLLASFREKAEACGMTALRSAYVQHLGRELFALAKFAQRHGREDELVSTADGGSLPTASYSRRGSNPSSPIPSSNRWPVNSASNVATGGCPSSTTKRWPGELTRGSRHSCTSAARSDSARSGRTPRTCRELDVQPNASSRG